MVIRTVSVLGRIKIQYNSFKCLATEWNMCFHDFRIYFQITSLNYTKKAVDTFVLA